MSITNVNMIPQDDSNVNPKISNAFAKAMQDYESLTAIRYLEIVEDDTRKSDALQRLATAISYSVLKKLVSVSYSDRLVSLRRDMARAIALLDSTAYSTNESTTIAYTRDGDVTTITLDSDLRHDSDTLLRETLGDGYDIVQTAILSLLEETAKFNRERRACVWDCDGWLSRPYEARKLRKSVYLMDDGDAPQWDTYTVTPIQVVYRAVRKYIQESGAIRDESTYSYLEDIATDEETGISETIYIRTGHYTDMGGYVRDYSGAETVYTVDAETAHDIQDIIARLGLTRRQTQILRLRLTGAGYGEIARKLGVSRDAIRRQLRLVQEHARQTMDVSTIVERETTTTSTTTSTSKLKLKDKDKKQICRMYDDGYAQSYIAKKYHVHKSTISRIIRDRTDRPERHTERAGYGV